jgi:MFS family permease
MTTVKEHDGNQSTEPVRTKVQTHHDEAIPDALDRRRRTGQSSVRRDFRLLWVGQSLSLVGDQIMVVALPLLAVTALGASAAQAALLPFALKLPFLVLGLPVGALLDRLRRRPTMMACEIIQAISYLVIAVLAALHLLPFWLLLLLIGVSGCAAVFFQVAYTSYLPALFTDAKNLHRANARLQLSESLSRSVGPLVAGPLIAVSNVMGAVFANAGTFVVSLLTLLGIRHREEPPAVSERQRGWLAREVRQGLDFVVRHPLLEPVLSCGSVYVLFQSMVMAVIVLYCAGVLQLSAAMIGVVVGAAALGYPVGNLLSGRLVDRLGLPQTLVLGAAVSVSGFVLMPIAGGAGSGLGLIVGSVIHGLGEGSFGPTWLTLRQTVTPAGLLGRVNAIERFLLWGAVPLGSLCASLSIRLIGLSGAMWLGALGTALCLPPLLRRGILAELRGGPSTVEVGAGVAHQGDPVDGELRTRGVALPRRLASQVRRQLRSGQPRVGGHAGGDDVSSAAPTTRRTRRRPPVPRCLGRARQPGKPSA